MNAQNGGQQQNNSNNKQGGLSWSSPAPKMPATPAAPVIKPVAPMAAKPAAPAQVSTVSSSNAAKIMGWLAVGVVAGVVIAWGATSLMKNNGATTANNGAQQGATSSTDGSNAALGSDISLTIATPQKAGYSVAVSSVVVSQPTWVVVYESHDGKPGNVLGAGLFSAAQSSGTVELLRATALGQTYFVTKQTDNGDRKFSLKDDTIVTVNGQPAWVTFTAN